MILIDAVFINNSGGKVLLDYLISELERTDLKIFYLLDKRIVGNHPSIKTSNPLEYIEGSLMKRHLFYLNHKEKFKVVFCFGNIPPSLRLNSKVITYFHQRLFLEISSNLSRFQKLPFVLKSRILFSLKKNSDFWIVQTEGIKNQLAEKLGTTQNICVLPFYPPLIAGEIYPFDISCNREFGFVYVSSGTSHKNHQLLLEAFKDFYLKNRKGKLLLTISKTFTDLYEKIEDLRKEGIPVVNYSDLPREGLIELYRSVKYCIYPSLSESFGLGLIEAMENGCDVLGADLPYTYAVCQPSAVFNPNDSQDISKVMERSLLSDLPKTQQIATDQVKELIDLLR